MHRKYYPLLEKCPNATEQRLIQNRLKQPLLDNDVCPKHRMKYGLGWRSSQKCQYPAHKIMKAKKCSANNRYISPAVAFEINHLFSSAAKPFNIPVGSKWCNNCGLHVHPDLKSKNLSLFETNFCMICSNVHQKEVDFSSSTPAKKPRTAPLSDDKYDCSDKSESFEEETSKETFNKSMAEIASNYWSPIKYQLRTNLNDVSERTKKRIIRKSLQAVDTVLDNIAPGQSQFIMATLTEQNNKNDVVDDIREAIQAANGSNNKIQLLSLMCGKSEDRYKYSITELMKIFPGVTKYQVEKAYKENL